MPKNSINSDIDMDQELNKLKMQSWNLMSMVKGVTTSDEQKIDNGSCENLMNDSQMQYKEEGVDRRRT